jgi:hypothetical protein
MRLISVVALLFAGAGICRAGDLNIHVILSGEVAPGVYGQVQLGSERPPPLVYAEPMLVVPQRVAPPPVYLHVPPGHAKNWRKHCQEYTPAIGRCTLCDRRNTNQAMYRAMLTAITAMTTTTAAVTIMTIMGMTTATATTTGDDTERRCGRISGPDPQLAASP